METLNALIEALRDLTSTLTAYVAEQGDVVTEDELAPVVDQVKAITASIPVDGTVTQLPTQPAPGSDTEVETTAEVAKPGVQ